MTEHHHTLQRLVCLAFFLLSIATLSAAVQITLTSGQVIVGDILFENEEVVVLKTTEGVRYQYPRSDIAEIGEVAAQQVAEEKKTVASRKVGLMLQVAGGGAFLPKQATGGFVSVDLKIGASNMMQKRIFLGGAVGYHAFILGGNKYGFVPLQVCAEIPFTLKQNAPYIGMGVGYGIAVNGVKKGGLFTSLEIGWRRQINTNTAFALALYSEYQQGMFSVSEEIDGTIYTQQAYRSLSTVGLKAGIHF